MSDDELPTTHLRTAWHPIFILLLQYLLPAERWRVVAEYLLSREPRRIDAVVIRCADPATLTADEWRPEYLRSVLDDLRPYNVGVAQPARAPLVPAHARVPRPAEAPRGLR